MRNRCPVLAVLGALLVGPSALGDPDAIDAIDATTAATPEQASRAAAAFGTVAQVLRHPRCMNCHPVGDAPLQGDDSQPHAMMITRNSPKIGLECTTCHRPTGIQGPHLPPAVNHWALPPANQVFQGRTDKQLCEQLNNPETTGGRDHAALLEHVRDDALVLYGWNPGVGRTVPDVPHADFVAAFETWVAGRGACPPN